MLNRRTNEKLYHFYRSVILARYIWREKMERKGETKRKHGEWSTGGDRENSDAEI